MNRRRVAVLLALFGALLFTILLAPKGSLPRRLILGESNDKDPSTPTSPTGFPPTKTERSAGSRDPRIEETVRLLRATVLDEIALDDLSLEEVIAKLNQAIQDAGVDPADLRLQLNHERGVVSASRVRALRLVDTSVAAILSEVTGQTATELRIKPRVVELVGSLDPVAVLERKLDHIVVPVIDFDETTLAEACDFLRSRSRESDYHTLEPELKGVSFVIRPTADKPGFEDVIIQTFKARRLTLRQALNASTERAGARWAVEESAVVIRPDPNQTTAEIHQRLAEIVLPKIDLEDASLEEAIDFLRQRSHEIDSEPNWQGGFNFVVRKPRLDGPLSEGAPDDNLDTSFLPSDPYSDPERKTPASPITLQAENISLAETLDLITAQTGMRWTIDEFAISIIPLPAP